MQNIIKCLPRLRLLVLLKVFNCSVKVANYY